MTDELVSRIAVLETKAEAAQERDAAIVGELKDAVRALWEAVDELRKRPAVSPVSATLISVLCLLLGFAANAALR